MALSLRQPRHIRRPGFTLVELLVVISIIALLATLVIASVSSSQLTAKITKAKSDLSQVANAVTALRQDTGVWPYGCNPNYGGDVEGPLDDVTVMPNVDVPPGQAGLISKPTNTDINSPMLHAYNVDGPHDYCLWTQAEINLWQGPYIAATKLVDPWGHAYYLDRDDVVAPPWGTAVESAGPDGAPNGSDDVVVPLVCGPNSCPFATYDTGQPWQATQHY